MISRLSAIAALFAIVVTGTVTYAASAHQAATATAIAAAAKPVRTVQLERVVVVGKRIDSATR